MACAVALDLETLGGHAVLIDSAVSHKRGSDGDEIDLWLRDPFHGWSIRLARWALVKALGGSTEATCLDVSIILSPTGRQAVERLATAQEGGDDDDELLPIP